MFPRTLFPARLFPARLFPQSRGMGIPSATFGQPTSRTRPHTIAITRRTWSNVDGDRVATETVETLIGVAVQPMSATDVRRHQLDGSQTPYTVRGFLSDPGVDAGDTIAWGTKTLAILGPATDQGGRGRTWSVDCVLRT